MVVHIFYTLKEFLIEVDFVLKIGEQWYCSLFSSLDFGCLVGFCNAEEDIFYPVKQLSALLECQDCILECRLLPVLYNLFYLCTLLFYTSLNGRKIVSALYFTEVGCAKWQCTFLH